jgi:hypothetical protein
MPSIIYADVEMKVQAAMSKSEEQRIIEVTRKYPLKHENTREIHTIG